MPDLFCRIHVGGAVLSMLSSGGLLAPPAMLRALRKQALLSLSAVLKHRRGVQPELRGPLFALLAASLELELLCESEIVASDFSSADAGAMLDTAAQTLQCGAPDVRQVLRFLAAALRLLHRRGTLDAGACARLLDLFLWVLQSPGLTGVDDATFDAFALLAELSSAEQREALLDALLAAAQDAVAARDCDEEAAPGSLEAALKLLVVFLTKSVAWAAQEDRAHGERCLETAVTVCASQSRSRRQLEGEGVSAVCLLGLRVCPSHSHTPPLALRSKCSPSCSPAARASRCAAPASRRRCWCQAFSSAAAPALQAAPPSHSSPAASCSSRRCMRGARDAG